MMRQFPKLAAWLIVVLLIISTGAIRASRELTEENEQIKNTLQSTTAQSQEVTQQLEQQIDQKDAENEELASALDTARQETQALKDKQVKVASDTSGWTSFRASYYNAGWASTGKDPSSQNYGITRSGHRVQAGLTASVDPHVIPLGSWIAVKFPDGAIETYRADDTGSAIRGNKLDIYIPYSDSVANANGIVNVKVKIIDKGAG